MGVYDIQGINCVFQVKIGDDYKTVVCAKSFTFNPVTDMKETTTVGSGFWKEFRPRKLSYTITFNGMLQVSSLTTQEVAKTLFTYQVQFLPLEYQLLYNDNSGNVMIVRGTTYISSSLFDASPVNLVNATQELQGSGAIEILDELPNPVNINIISTGDPSIAALIQFKLMNGNGDIIFDSGQLPGASGGDLTHPVNVTGQVQSGSYYFFWQVTAASIGNQFNLDAPPTKTTNFNDNTNSESSFGVQIYDFTADRNVEFVFGTPTPPPACVAPSITSGSTLPDGQVGTAYSYSIIVNGSQPFNITNVTKPSWLSITIIGGNTVLLSGTPDVSGTGITVAFDINNACGSVSISDTIDIAIAPVTTSLMKWELFDTSGLRILRLYRNGTLVIDTNAESSGQFVINDADVIEVQYLGPAGFLLKHLAVLNETDSITMYDSTGFTNRIFSFTSQAGKQYFAFGD